MLQIARKVLDPFAQDVIAPAMLVGVEKSPVASNQHPRAPFVRVEAMLVRSKMAQRTKEGSWYP